MKRTAMWTLAGAGVLVLGSAALAGDDGAKQPAPSTPASPPAPDKPSEKTPEQALQDLLERLKSKDLETRRSAAEESVSNLAPELTGLLMRLLVDEDAHIRYVAVASLGKRGDEKSKRTAAGALEACLVRLGEAGDAGEKLLLVESLHDLAQESSIKPLIDGIKNETPKEEVEARLHAVGNVPSREAIESLINFAAACGRGRRADWHQSVRSALRYAARTDVGGADPDLWRQWWRNNEKRFDFAGAAEDRARERAAADEKERRKKEGGDKPPRKGGKKGDGKKEDPPPSDPPK